jgi:hypothetical protein
MSTTRLDTSASRRPLRLWPGIIAAVGLLFGRIVLPVLWPDVGPYGVLSGAVFSVLILLWWLFFSRAAWIERIGALVLIVAATFVTKLLAHPSMSGGLMGMMVPMYAVPMTIGPVFVAWAAATRRSPDMVRRTTMVFAIVIGCAVWVLVRTDGIMGKSGAQFAWRWTPTAEERLLAKSEERATPEVATQSGDTSRSVPPQPRRQQSLAKTYRRQQRRPPASRLHAPRRRQPQKRRWLRRPHPSAGRGSADRIETG